MSINGLTQQYQPPTLDGLVVLEADELYLDGSKVDLDNVVPYTGATKTVDLGSQNIKTSHSAASPSDLVNLATLQEAITYVDNANALTYLNKITGADQTVVAATTFNTSVTSPYFYSETSYNFSRNSASYHAWTIQRILNGALMRDLQFRDGTGNQNCLLLSSDGQTVYVGLTADYATASKIPIFDANKKLVSSGVDASKIDYLDNVSSDIQTQLNGKLNLSGSNANQDIVLGAYKVQSSGIPSSANDLTNKAYVDSSISGAGSLYVLKSGDTMTGPLTISSGALTANTRLLGVPDGNPGNFWIGLTGSGSEVDRLAISINGATGTGVVSNVTVSKPFYLNDTTASRVLVVDSNKKVTSSIASVTEIGYLSGVTNSIQTQLDTKASTTYVNSQDNLRVLKAGDEMTGTLKNVGGEFWPYTGGDVNKSCRLFANNGDGADYTTYNGGLKSWFGIAFYSAYDSTVRHVFNTRDGSSKQTGQIDCGSLTTDGTITTTGIGTNAGVLAKRYYLSARGDNQDEKAGDEKFGPWYGVGDSGIPGFTGNPCLAGYYGCALRSGNGFLVLTGGGSVGIGTTNPSRLLELSTTDPFAINITRTSAGNNYGNGIIHSLTSSTGNFKGNYARVLAGSDGAIATSAQSQCQGYYCIDIAKNGVFKSDTDATTSAFYMTNSQGLFNIPVGVVGQVSIGLSDVTTPNIKFSNTNSHIDNLAGEAYLFTGYNGHISIGRNTTRSATTCNLALGVASTDEAQIISASTDGSAFLPMSFASTRYTFTNGGMCVAGASPYALLNGFMKKGTITMGSTTEDYGGGTGYWSSNTAGMMMECKDYTEFAVHDAGQRVSSFMYYNNNVFEMGRNMGWGTANIRVKYNLFVDNAIGVGTTSPTTIIEAVGAGTMIGARNTNSGDNYCGMRLGNDTGYGCYWFLNSSTRSADGGYSTATLRNDLGSMRLQSSGGNGLIVEATTGHVGINTDNPQCQFYNFGTGSSGWQGWSFSGNATTGIVSGSYDNKAFLGGHSGALNAWTDVYLAPGGNVMIGSTDVPSYKLQVNGSVYVESGIYNNNWFRCISPATGLYWENFGYGLWSPDAINGYANPTTVGNVQCYGTPKGGHFGYNVPLANIPGVTYGGLCFASTQDQTRGGLLHTWGNGPNQSYSVFVNYNEINTSYCGAGSVRMSQDWDRILAYANGSNTGSGYFYYNQANSYGTISDRRIKKDFLPIKPESSIAFLQALEPTSFCLKQNDCCDNAQDGVEPAVCSCRQDGWVAQNVLEACEKSGASKSVINHWYDYEQELNKPEEERKTLIGVSDRPILSHTVNVVKILLEVVDEQNQRLKEQDAKIEKLAALVAQLIK